MTSCCKECSPGALHSYVILFTAHAHPSDSHIILDAFLSVFEENIFTKESLTKLTYDLAFFLFKNCRIPKIIVALHYVKLFVRSATTK